MPALALLFGACATPGDDAPDREIDAAPSSAPEATVPSPPFSDSARAIVYHCDDRDFVVQFEGDAARLALRDGGRTLQPERAASGVRYTDGGTTVVWTHGEEARIEVDGETYEGCSADRPAGIEAAAALRGAEFRASGNEPGWYAEIDDGNTVTLVWDYGERRAVTPAPDARTDESQRTVYDIETEAHTVRIVIADEACVDDAGREYPSTVTLTIDDRTLIGCGRALEAYRPLS